MLEVQKEVLVFSLISIIWALSALDFPQTPLRAQE